MAQMNIVYMSKVINDAGSRIESEYYHQDYADNKQVLLSLPHTKLINLLEIPVKTGHTPSMKVRGYYGGTIAFIKTDNLHDYIIQDNFKDYLTDRGNEVIPSSALRERDILTTIIGATYDVIARSSIVRRSILPANINQNIALIRILPDKAVPEYISVYLNSKYGKTYLRYLSRQTGQVNLNCREVEQVLVPIFSIGFQRRIGNVVDMAYAQQDQAKTCYANAKKLLLDTLGLADFTPTAKKTTVKNASTSFFTKGRIDAEYYHEKYTETETALHTRDTVRSLCNIHEGIFIPVNGDYKYIELANIGYSGNITGATVAPFVELPSRARRLVKKGQVIISSIEGSLSSCALITDAYDGAICSTGFYVVDSSCINSETLLVLFKSPPIQALLKKRCSGTILTAISKTELENMPLPFIEDMVQRMIAEQVRQSFALRHQSEQLLDTAKSTVELAIEQGEDKAIAWLGTQSLQ